MGTGGCCHLQGMEKDMSASLRGEQAQMTSAFWPTLSACFRCCSTPSVLTCFPQALGKASGVVTQRNLLVGCAVLLQAGS